MTLPLVLFVSVCTLLVVGGFMMYEVLGRMMFQSKLSHITLRLIGDDLFVRFDKLKPNKTRIFVSGSHVSGRFNTSEVRIVGWTAKYNKSLHLDVSYGDFHQSVHIFDVLNGCVNIWSVSTMDFYRTMEELREYPMGVNDE